MSKLVHSEALVLKSRPFSESSKITTLLARRSGRIDVLAHGARKPGSRFGASLEPGTVADFIYYERENKSLWTLSSADIIISHQNLRENGESLLLLVRILRFLNHLSQPGETNIGLYNLTLSVLNAMENGGAASTIFEFYIWRAARVSGYPPRITEGCMVCGRKTASMFSIPAGGFLCREHASPEDGIINLTAGESGLLVKMSQDSPSEFFSKPPQLPRIISRLIRRYASYHLHAPDSLIE
jgi:DNA repair protein RecO (recombination protein O)